MAFQASISPATIVGFLLAACFLFGASDASNAHIYIVYMGEKLHDDPEIVTASHHSLLTSLLGSKEEALGSIIYSYRHGFSGFAAKLTAAQAKELQESPDVISIKRSRTHQVHTTRSWDFLGLTQSEPANELLEKSNFGDGMIIGMVDTGIWPESRSFNDEGYGPVPSRWKGVCQIGQAFSATNCSRKIIGARWYAEGVKQDVLKEEYLSPRDSNGHGTHTASTAAGNYVHNVSFRGLGAGTVRGGAPHARLAIYKACWGAGRCLEAAVLKAIDDAIHDGVDVLSLSIGGDGFPSATIRAAAKGINIVFVAGNDGPAPQTVGNALPWVVTAAATSIDRSFSTDVTLGNYQMLVGQSIYTGSQSNFTELAYGASCSAEDLNGTDVTGKIVFCYSPSTVALTLPRVQLPEVITTLSQTKASGIIYAQYTTNILDNLYACKGIPCVLVGFRIANVILNYMDSARVPIVMVSPTRSAIGTQVLAPKVGAFSSRGPSPDFPAVLKPDVAAPGVSILAAVEDSYLFLSGTSMACPHVSGVLALLKSVHPNWSPAALKSAIITTASIVDPFGLPIEAEGLPRKIADAFDYGGGQIKPSKAADPGLIFDIDPKDYFEYFNCTLRLSNNCQSEVKPLYNLNLPSVVIPELKTSVTVWRTVANVGEAEAVYKAAIHSPAGVEMTVEPSVLEFNATNRVRTFAVKLKAKHRVQGDYRFGSLTWDDGGLHLVRMQIAVRVVIQSFYADTA